VSWLLERVFGRLPIGWLQLTHNRARLFAALAGVSFANILVFMQLGFLGALVGSIGLPYQQMNVDVMISASDMNTLADGGPLPRQRMYQALAVPGVVSAAPLYYGKIDWKQPDGTVRTLDAFGIDPSAITFNNEEINDARGLLAMPDRAIIDRKTRNVPGGVFAKIDRGASMTFESKGRTLTVPKTFTIGGGFSADGYLIVSDQTFFRLFPQRSQGAPNHIFLKLAPSADAGKVIADLRKVIPAYDSAVRTRAEAISKDMAFQTTQRPVGIVFGFGIIIGVIVGIIIVYQVLSSDVADHMREYATMKAIGYRQRFFISIILEEALVLAILGFIPGVIVAVLLYFAVAAMTGLPVAMTVSRAFMVLAGTIFMCVLSGIVATRKLARANPADLF
jgi:putative ABC transport system permease protein